MHLCPFRGVKIALKMFPEQITSEWYLLNSHENQKPKSFLGHWSPSAPVYYIYIYISLGFPEYLLNSSTSFTTTTTTFIILVSKPLTYSDRTFVFYLTHLHFLALIPEAKGKLQIRLHLPFSFLASSVAFHCFWDHCSS